MRRRVLVVDDEPGMLRAVSRVLERDYDVSGTTSAMEAPGLCETFAPDLAIVDIRMPDSDGFELLSRLKREHPDLDVILMTGSLADTDDKLARAIRAKAFYFIQKPFDRQVLLALVARCMELRQLSEDNRRHVKGLETVLDEARTFQASMIPAAEARFGSASVHARLQASDRLCGDFYDYSACEEGLAFLVADVSGHGAVAAMLTGVVKSAFQSCQRDEFDPRAVVDRISAGLRTFGANRFVTLFAGTIREATGELRYVNAGHPPAISWSGQEAPELLAPTGPIVSPVLDTATWAVVTRDLAADHHLLLYTDGLIEARGELGFFGLERLVEVACGARAGGCECLDAVERAVENHTSGRRIEDDVTLLCVDLAGRG